MNLSEHVRFFFCVLNYFLGLGLVCWTFTCNRYASKFEMSTKEKMNTFLSYLRKKKTKQTRKNPVRKFSQNLVIILTFLGAAESWTTQNQRWSLWEHQVEPHRHLHLSLHGLGGDAPMFPVVPQAGSTPLRVDEKQTKKVKDSGRPQAAPSPVVDDSEKIKRRSERLVMQCQGMYGVFY